jgi:signal transduction histidine kinase
MLYRQQQNFINGFTHELKTPIASIKIFLDTFKMHELPRQEQLKYLDLMIKDTQRLSENVNQILNLGKLEERNFQADLETIHPHQLIYSIVEKDEAFSQRMELTFDNKLADDVLVKIDFSLMEILVRNFLSNALNYSNKERPSVVITFRMDDKKQVVVDFCDDGIGIPPAEQKKIFRKFYQVGKSVKGSGLGLYMVSQIAKFHKGRVKVFSKGLGEGSQFTLILPQALESSHE